MPSLGGQPDILIDPPGGPTFEVDSPATPADVLVVPQVGPAGPSGASTLPSVIDLGGPYATTGA